jgi:FKBP-type peptidyl-prolyl cis-trans isomerase
MRQYLHIIKIVIFTVIVSFSAIACSSVKNVEQEKVETVKKLSGLLFRDIKKGNGKTAVLGSKVSVNYILKNLKGDVFENSYNSNLPLSFTIGSDAVVKGLDEGITNMKVGGKRIIYIPPELGFQGRNILSFDKNDTIVIEAELLNVE